MTHEAYIYDAVRTPRGKGKPGGSLYEVKPVRLLADLLTALERRNPNLDRAAVDDIVCGCVTAVGEQGGCIAKAAAFLAQWPDDVPGVTLNRFCASGSESVNLAAQKVRSGWEQLVVAGGVESMSRVPMGSDGAAMALDPETNLAFGFMPQGIGADLIATLDGLSREEADLFALESHRRAAEAWKRGAFAKSVVPVVDANGIPILDHDETVRPDGTMDALAKLKPSFLTVGQMGYDGMAREKYPQVERIDHVHTPGNSSGIVDGAALLLLGNEQAGKDHGLTARGRVVSTAVVGTDPTIMLTGPAPASRKALKLAGLTVDDIDLFEVNEAFASVPLHFQREIGVAADEMAAKMNVNGGAIAMGHPLGATGAMLIATVLDELEYRSERYGLVTLCVGGGMGIATVVERL